MFGAISGCVWCFEKTRTEEPKENRKEENGKKERKEETREEKRKERGEKEEGRREKRRQVIRCSGSPSLASISPSLPVGPSPLGGVAVAVPLSAAPAPSVFPGPPEGAHTPTAQPQVAEHTDPEPGVVVLELSRNPLELRAALDALAAELGCIGPLRLPSGAWRLVRTPEMAARATSVAQKELAARANSVVVEKELALAVARAVDRLPKRLRVRIKSQALTHCQ